MFSRVSAFSSVLIIAGSFSSVLAQTWIDPGDIQDFRMAMYSDGDCTGTVSSIQAPQRFCQRDGGISFIVDGAAEGGPIISFCSSLDCSGECQVTPFSPDTCLNLPGLGSTSVSISLFDTSVAVSPPTAGRCSLIYYEWPECSTIDRAALNFNINECQRTGTGSYIAGVGETPNSAVLRFCVDTDCNDCPNSRSFSSPSDCLPEDFASTGSSSISLACTPGAAASVVPPPPPSMQPPPPSMQPPPPSMQPPPPSPSSQPPPPPPSPSSQPPPPPPSPSSQPPPPPPSPSKRPPPPPPPSPSKRPPPPSHRPRPPTHTRTPHRPVPTSWAIPPLRPPIATYPSNAEKCRHRHQGWSW